MSSVNPYGIRPARLTANGQAFTGTSTFYVPEPGVLITEGLYVEVPANTSVNFFYEVV